MDILIFNWLFLRSRIYFQPIFDWSIKNLKNIMLIIDAVNMQRITNIVSSWKTSIFVSLLKKNQVSFFLFLCTFFISATNLVRGNKRFSNQFAHNWVDTQETLFYPVHKLKERKRRKEGDVIELTTRKVNIDWNVYKENKLRQTS